MTQTDEITQTLARGGARSSDEIAAATAGTAASVIRHYDPMSVISRMGRGSFFQNLNLPKIELTSSKIFHTPDYLSNLTNVDLDDLIPKNTGDILDGLSGTLDEIVPTGVTDDFAEALAKNGEDIIDPDVVKAFVNNRSLNNLKGITDDVAESTAENAARKIEIDANANTSTIDEFTEATTESAAKTNLNNVDEMTDSLKKSSGFADEISDSAENALKKADGAIDDAAEKIARDTIWDDIAHVMGKYDGYVSIGIFAAFLISQHINGTAPWSGEGLDEEFSDPIEVQPVDEIEYILNIEEIVDNHKEVPEDSPLESNALALAIVAGFVAFLSL